MNKNILFFLAPMLWGTYTYAGIFDSVSTLVNGAKNFITTGGKACTRCGEPYNVRCMDLGGNPKEFVPFMIESCYAPFDGGCRPTPEIMNNARKYCSDKGWMLNEKAAAKQDDKRGLMNNQVNSVTKMVNGLLPAATAVGGIAAGIMTHDGAAAEAGAQAGASMMQSQNDKQSLKLQKKQLNMQSQALNQQAAMVQYNALNALPKNANTIYNPSSPQGVLQMSNYDGISIPEVQQQAGPEIGQPILYAPQPALTTSYVQ